MAETGIEQLGGLEQIYERLEALKPETGEWLKLIVGVLEDYETDAYRANPQLLKHILPDLDDDTNELINYLLQISTDKKEELRTVLTELESELRTNRPVIAYALIGIFDYFKISSEESTLPNSRDARPRFHMPNILFSSRTEVERFYVACGLTEDFSRGKGGHHGWNDSNGRYITQSSDSKKVWAKNVIKELIGKGIPIGKIKEACDKSNIPFTIL